MENARSFDFFVNKCLKDEMFMNQLHENPEKAFQSIGIEPTEELLEALKEIMENHKDPLINLAMLFSDEDGKMVKST